MTNTQFPPPASPEATPELIPPRARRTAGRVAATAVAGALVLGGGLFAVTQMDETSAAEGGAKTPEAAVEQMFSSLEQNDLIGVLDHLAPGERDVLRDAAVDYIGELKRLGVLSDDLDPEAVDGFDVDFENLTFEAEQANPRVWLVELTGGQASFGVDVADLPYGDIFDELVAEIPKDEMSSGTVTVDIAEELHAAEMPLRIAVVEQDGLYFVSSFYTAAETLAAASGHEMPATPIAAAGSASPEGAVLDMINASIDLDVERVIALTPPDEMAALHDYGPILVDLANDAITESDIREEMDDLTISIDAFETESVPVSGGSKVLPVHIAFRVSTPEDGDFEFDARKVDDTCVAFSYRLDGGVDGVEEDSGRYCAADLYDVFADSEVPAEVQDIAVRMAGQLGQLGVVTVEVDGAWYVSPTRSTTDVLLVAFQGLQDGDLRTLADWFFESLSMEFDEFELGED